MILQLHLADEMYVIKKNITNIYFEQNVCNVSFTPSPFPNITRIILTTLAFHEQPHGSS